MLFLCWIDQSRLFHLSYLEPLGKETQLLTWTRPDRITGQVSPHVPVTSPVRVTSPVPTCCVDKFRSSALRLFGVVQLLDVAMPVWVVGLQDLGGSFPSLIILWILWFYGCSWAAGWGLSSLAKHSRWRTSLLSLVHYKTPLFLPVEVFNL